MTDPQKYWLTDGQGNFAQVAGAEEREHWVTQGWSETGQPTEGFLLVWHPDIELPGRAPVAFFDGFLAHAGWVVGPPEGGDNPTTTAQAKPAAGKPVKSTTPAAGGNEKE